MGSRAWFVGVLACGCYVGVDGAPDAAGETSVGDPGGDVPEEPDDPDDADPGPELGDCDPSAIASSTLRRLNRREYRNTVQDLFGLAQLPELALPWDNLNSVGFDNDGATLTLDAGAAGQYYDAAEAIASAVADRESAPLHECAQLSGDGLSMCVATGLGDWLRRAFRRPASERSLEALRGLLAGQQSYSEIADTVVVFTLTSPQFLFHYKSTAPREDGVVDGFELADRLAYLVWSSAPDDALLDAAESGALAETSVLAAEVTRMLADPRAQRFYADFPGLWLKLGLLAEKPDAATHGDLFDDMRAETTAFFEHVAKSDADVGALLDNDRSVINGRLADHYGIDVALGDNEWELVDLPADERTGLLTHGSVLVASSGSEFSDPIRRGSWVAQQIACQQPPPPPFEPPVLPDPEDVGASTVREVLEQHRSDPSCAGCHALIDPYGLALENYDPLGLFRTAYDSGERIDPSGELVSGIAFTDTIDLSRKLAQQDDFERCVASFIFAYGAGRVLDDDEACFVELAIEQAHAQSGDASVEDLLVAFVSSYLFAVTGGVE